jgi:hypothetical protein
MAGLFGGAPSSLSAAPATSAAVARPPSQPGAPEAPADANALIAGAAQDLSDYQRLTAEGKLGEAGRKLEELKAKLEALNRIRR